jgi:predicted dienelactone hydrolase
VVIFSHGLGGTTDGGGVWGEAWSAAGLVVLHLQHAGSDLAAVRAVTSSFADQRALQSVANVQQFLNRMQDVVFVLDELGRRQTAGAGRWARVRPTAVGMSGHSFGALTTLAMAGQRFPGYLGLKEPRLASFVAFSPSLPLQIEARRSFEPVDRPVLSITGTLDGDVVGTGSTADRRRLVFGALPAGHKAHLVLNDADHMTFAGQTGRAAEIIPREQATRDLQPAHHALVAKITTDWWGATLAGDAAAQTRLLIPSGMMPGDEWERG